MKAILFLLFGIGVQCPTGKSFTPFFTAGAKHDDENHFSEIPFEFEDGIIILKGSLNNGLDTFDFVLDSGAPTTVTSAALKTSSSRLLESGTMADITNNEKSVDQYLAYDVMVGDKHFGPIEVWSSNHV